MFTFPQETNTAHVRLNTPMEDFSAVTVCLRFFTDLVRDHTLFSLATPSTSNDFLIFPLKQSNSMIELSVRNQGLNFGGQEIKLNTWNSLCATWESESGLGQLWLNGQSSSRKFISSGSNIAGRPIITLGQDQDSYGGGFDASQSFTGMITDVHMWNYVLPPRDIRRYKDLNITPGNVLNWRALYFQITGRVLLEKKRE
ncbi:LOW QUALITY PROTEIN: jeltraxin-like [Diretmus argenteus]